jgi:hypothetical protein
VGAANASESPLKRPLQHTKLYRGLPELTPEDERGIAAAAAKRRRTAAVAKRGSSGQHGPVSTRQKAALNRAVLLDRATALPQLLKAAEADDCVAVRHVLDSGPADLVTSTDQYGWTPLMVAAAAGACGVVKLLLRSGATLTLTVAVRVFLACVMLPAVCCCFSCRGWAGKNRYAPRVAILECCKCKPGWETTPESRAAMAGC